MIVPAGQSDHTCLKKGLAMLIMVVVLGLMAIFLPGCADHEVTQISSVAPGYAVVTKFPSLAAAVTKLGKNQAVLLIDNPLNGAELTIPDNIHLKFTVNGRLTIPAGRSVVLNGPLEAPVSRIFAGDGRVILGKGNITVFPEWWGDDAAAFRKAVEALPLSGGTVRLQAKFYRTPFPPAAPLRKDNIRITGAGMPHFKVDYSGLEGGTIIQGPFFVQANNVVIRELGVDSGKTVVKDLYKGVGQEAFVVSDPASLNDTRANINSVLPFVGLVAQNISAICSDPETPYHAALFENVDGALVSNISTAFCLHGIVFKATNITADKLRAVGSGANGVIIKGDVYADTAQGSYDDISIGSVNGYDGAGLTVFSASGKPVEQITISNARVKGTKYGIQVKACPTCSVRNVILSNCTVQDTDFDGIQVGGGGYISGIRLESCTSSNNRFRGFISDLPAADITLVNCTARNNGQGDIVVRNNGKNIR